MNYIEPPTDEVPMKVNINNFATVTLTERGAIVWNDYHASTRTMYPLSYPFKKAGDVVRDELWSIMHIFGNSLYNGRKTPFEGNVMDIEGGDWSTVQ